METLKSAATSLRIGASVRMPAWLANRARKSTTDGDPGLRTRNLASPRGEIRVDEETLTRQGWIESARSAMGLTEHCSPSCASAVTGGVTFLTRAGESPLPGAKSQVPIPKLPYAGCGLLSQQA